MNDKKIFRKEFKQWKKWKKDSSKWVTSTLQNITHSLYKQKRVDAHQFNAMMMLIKEYDNLSKE